VADVTCAWTDPNYDGPAYRGHARTVVRFTARDVGWCETMFAKCKEMREHECGCHATFGPAFIPKLLGPAMLGESGARMEYILQVYGDPDHVRPLVNEVMERNMMMTSR
jgi:hypothetical protein